MDGRPTLQSVADRASVSRQTVSNVLNAPHLVRPETLDRVRSVIDEVGYRPHGAARQLRTRRSQVIGLRLQPSADGVNGAVLDRFMHALTEQAQVRGYRIMLFTAPDDHGEIAQYSELLDTLELDAFVLTSTHRGDARTRWLADRGVPFVTFGRPWDPPDGDGDGTDAVASRHAWVDVDGAHGTRTAVEHLQGLGHSRIAFLGWPVGSDVGDDRRAGWRRAMRASGVADHELDALDVGVEDGVANGGQAARRLMDLLAPTAFVCASDSLALGALAATRSVTGSGPGSTIDGAVGVAPAVIGFDDTPVARAVGLSSVAQPLTEAAGQALALLLDQLSGQRPGDEPPLDLPDDRHVLLCPSLAIRSSSRIHG
ncbi:MAG TPA: LacI family DNA-binding transcriptional regulator [Actinotalea sp.]|jgi:DNA-binding LacI/PurR family transcriptional regulator